MIWEYSQKSALKLSEKELEVFSHSVYSKNPPRLCCQYCKSQMAKLNFKQDPCQGGVTDTHVEVCQACGWWVVTHYVGYSYGYEGFVGVNRAAGSLRNLDLTDISTPSQDIGRYLLTRYDDRFWLNPKKYEDIVAGVFSDFGFRVRVTSYSHDDGIDIFVFDGNDDKTVGIQVKRYRGKIGVEQIRSFAGALLLNGLTTGIFVTTSQFTAGAANTSLRYGEAGIGIELWDAEKFYDKLQLSKLRQFTFVDDTESPYFSLIRNTNEVPQVYGRGW